MPAKRPDCRVARAAVQQNWGSRAAGYREVAPGWRLVTHRSSAPRLALWKAGIVRSRVLALCAVAALLAATWLALAPFHDREVPCGPPLFGADPGANYSITPGTCSDAATDRLRIAAVLVGGSVVLVLASTRFRRPLTDPDHQVDREAAHT